MKLAYLELSGFRGYRKQIRIEFADRFTIIDGRNGVGKSTIFDAIEFALTGRLSKYDDAKASNETVDDYVWWIGDRPWPGDCYVEVGFVDGDSRTSIRRGQFHEPDQEDTRALAEALCDPRLAPATPLGQLCASTIIRDEHITRLSLDLKETDRYNLLRDALGATDADDWIARAGQIVSLAKRRTASSQQEVAIANADVAAAARRLDEVRANLLGETVIAEAVERIRAFADTVAAPEQLVGPARERIVAIGVEMENLQALAEHWVTADQIQSQTSQLASAVEAAKADKQVAAAALQQLTPVQPVVSAEFLAMEVQKLIALFALGRQIGLRDGGCPLCTQSQSQEEFEQGIQKAEGIARGLNESAARAAEREHTYASALAKLAVVADKAEMAQGALAKAMEQVSAFEQRRNAAGIAHDATIEQVSARIVELRRSRDAAQKDLRILETLRLNLELERALKAESDAKHRFVRAQEHFSRARKAESSAQTLHDSARRAASETLDRRLDRVLPLLAELYRRLRPHPVWTDIEYSIRGDVRRFLKLQIGENLNPQFLFSSGQRRATGLAFLLSVNLSLAWSRWRSILLDDPVQHVDDFRAVQLAELVSHVVADGRQVICAVEDAALADLLCRRLPIGRVEAAKRITLGMDADGALGKIREDWLTPPLRQSLVPSIAAQSVAS